MSATSKPQHVVFGAGAIGTTLVDALVRRRETGIRLVNRTGQVGLPRVWSTPDL